MKNQTTSRPLQVGDYVRVPSHVSDNICKITLIYQDRASIYDGKTCVGVPVGIMKLVPKSEIFLSRLQSLLREFDASFDFYDVYDMAINIGDEELKYTFLNGENAPLLNADNIMDYEKE